ncbi:deubiquitinating protein VCPIP1 isoform X2 [Boleophthalmus pectinirostris]|uniref:deubiquitinating protein VCPIP1 isoform X2 n=1 Tax=Boleophthalmus pectinirostris TaxID=150288 RepID=UPI00242B83CF|nr:deubiquitinating protein VCPIP1 isoform X2 [Boleophthalmus pectinirostris]
MSLLQGSKKKDKRILSGTCPDPRCEARLFFPAHGSVSIECTECGQRHDQKSLLRVEEVTDPDVVLHNLLRNALLGVSSAPKKGTELVKVMGLSNYHCKLLSPVLTRYGMDKQSGKAKLLRDMNQGEMFDCSLLGDRAFLIEPEHVSTVGYGKDRSGSLIYLHDTLEEVKRANGGGECLIPVHVDGDGHCLVHAVSRALVGRELFWHALRENLKHNFKQNLDRYKALFQDFIDAAEWEDIINECDPLFIPPEGVPLGLRNIHIFGLANVLHRPIILLDSLSGMRSSGDYSATFLPGLVPEEQCRAKDGKLNKPICIAWSSSGRNHYIPLVGIKNTVLPKLPSRLLPKAWGVPQELIPRYIKLEADGSCVIGGDRSLQDKYLMRLVNAMEEVFMEKHSIHPSLVADVHQYVYRRTGVIGIQPEEVTEAAKKCVQENRLHRCLLCGALSELHVPPEWLSPGGKLYNLAKSTHGQLRPDKNYSFPLNSVVCSYDPHRDTLVPDYKLSSLSTCNWCHGTSVRRVRGNGSVVYLDGDRTHSRSQGGKCGCGFKHYWEGKEYDNLPEAFPITLEWAGRVVRETVYWFQYETDPTLNSNVYDVAMKLVTKHFPGEFGSEILVQKVVNTILHHTAKKNPDEYNPVSIDGAHAPLISESEPPPDPHPPTKIILTGQKAKTLHKEELTMSKAERSLQQSISEQAGLSQKRRTDKLKQEQKMSEGRVSPDSSSPSSSAPATPTKSPSSSSSNKEKKLRVTTSDGRQAMLTLQANTTFTELQKSIAKEFNVPPSQQCIRHGFPPKELLPPKDGEENEPVALQHGDRVSVEILVRKGPEEKSLSSHSAATNKSQETGARSQETGASRASRELQDSIDLEMSSLCLLATLMGEDVWSYAKKLPHLFQQGGVFYNIVKKDMGLLDGKHCTLPHLTGKTFVYSAAEDRLELCVDTAGHFPVGPDVEELVKEAMLQLRSEASRGSREGSPSHNTLKLGSGGVVLKKEQLHSVTAFQGKGHSLGSSSAGSPPEHRTGSSGQSKGHSLTSSIGGSSPPDHRPITRQHSSGVDLSASVSRGPADLSDIAEDASRELGNASRELVRMAPGFVTMKDGRGGLDPEMMEQQRRALQEMVSSIQASMERNLREQRDRTASSGQSQQSAARPLPREEEPEDMESQDVEQGSTEPMDHS